MILEVLAGTLVFSLVSFFLVSVTPDDWVEAPMSSLKRLWGVLLTPGLLVAVAAQSLTAANKQEAISFREDMAEYLGAVWLGREFS